MFMLLFSITLIFRYYQIPNKNVLCSYMSSHKIFYHHYELNNKQFLILFTE